MLMTLEDKNPPDANNFTSLHLAAIYDHLDVVKYLTKAKIKTNPHASYYWKYATPLTKASQYARLDIVKYLVEIDPENVNEKTQPGFFGQTAYEVSLQEGDITLNVTNFLSQFVNNKIYYRNKGFCEDG